MEPTSPYFPLLIAAGATVIGTIFFFAGVISAKKRAICGADAEPRVR